MMRAKKLIVIAVLLMMGLAALSVTGANAIVIEYEAISLGGSSYEYVYSVTNDGSLGGSPVTGFNIEFDPLLYLEASLSITQEPIGWQTDPFFDGGLILGSISPGIAPAAYDTFTLGPGILDSQVLSGFTVAFDWLGAGTPGSQAFYIYDPVTFSTLEGGNTELKTTISAVPEPSTILLLGTGLLLFGLRAKRIKKQRGTI